MFVFGGVSNFHEPSLQVGYFSNLAVQAAPVPARSYLPSSMLLPVAVAAGSIGGLYIYDVCAWQLTIDPEKLVDSYSKTIFFGVQLFFVTFPLGFQPPLRHKWVVLI